MDQDEITRGYCKMLDSCETRSRAELQKQHLIMLERLCRHARKTTDFYRERLAPLFDNHDQFHMQAWDDVPPLTRTDLFEHFEALKSRNTPKNFGNIRIARSSGSTGQPVKALWTDTQVIATHCIGRRLHRWHKVDARDFLVLVYAMPDQDAPLETEHTHWAPVYRSLGIAGRCVTINGQLPTQHIRQRLEELQPDHLNINPRLLFAIANDYLSRNKKPNYALKSVGTFGESRTDLIDTRIEQVFGVRPYSRYTADEIGHIAIECPDCGNYHVAGEVMHADVVDIDLQPIAPGGSGRVLATPLYSYAMPLIRYELGDEVSVTSVDCKRSQGLDFAQIEGRLGDLFFHPDGERFRPNRMIITKLANHLQAMAVQIVQQKVTRFTIRYQSKSGSPLPSDIMPLKQELENSFGFPATVDLAPVQEIPALANGKREDFVCLVQR